MHKFFLLAVVAGLMASCEKKNEQVAPTPSLIGEWMFEYTILEDGSRNYDDPYALLEFEYSDGFILKENGQANSVWYQKVNGEFEWEKAGEQLIFSVTRPDNSVDTFTFEFSDLTLASLLLKTPKGHVYKMLKK